MSHHFRRMLNKFGEETTLKNCLPEIKDVPKAELNCIKQVMEAAREIDKWGKEQEPEIAIFLATMLEIETEISSHRTQFVDDFSSDFLSRWKEILRDRAELREVIVAHKKAKAKVEKAMERIENAKRKEEKLVDGVKEKHDDAVRALKTAEAELPEITTLEVQAGQLVKEKMVEVQKEMHDAIRMGYYNLFDARMKYFREAAISSERALQSTSRFLAVKGTGADGDFEFEPYAESPGPNAAPIWHKGELYYQQLQVQLEAAKHGMDAQMGQLREGLEREIVDLKAKLEAERNSRTGAVRDAVDSGDSRLRSELLQIVLAMGSQNVSDASDSLERDIIDMLATKTREAHDATLSLAESPIFNLPILARAVFGSLFSAVGAAYTLTPGKSQELFALARQAAKDAKELFDLMTTRAATDPSGTTLTDDGSTQPLLTSLQALALYADSAAPIGGGPIKEGATAAQMAILEALDVIKSLQATSESTESDRVQELNKAILSHSTDMFGSAKALIDACVVLHTLLEADSDGLSESESKLRIRKLAAVLNEAVVAILDNTPVWIECARQVVKGKGKFEEMQISSKDISACTAQLLAFVRSTFTSSKHNVDVLKRSCEQLQSNSHSVMAAVREAQQYKLANIVLDDAGDMTETQVKKMVMASQISISQLEAQLEKERERLNRLRRMNYSEEKKKSVNVRPTTTPSAI